MATYDERLAALEQIIVTLRTELTQALNKIRQLEQHRIDSNHQQTMLLGIAYGQEENIRTIKEDVGIIKEGVERRFDAVDGRLSRLETKFDEHSSLLAQQTGLLTQILARLPEK